MEKQSFEVKFEELSKLFKEQQALQEFINCSSQGYTIVGYSYGDDVYSFELPEPIIEEVLKGLDLHNQILINQITSLLKY